MGGKVEGGGVLAGTKVRLWPGGLEATVKALEVDGKVRGRGRR